MISVFDTVIDLLLFQQSKNYHPAQTSTFHSTQVEVREVCVA